MADDYRVVCHGMIVCLLDNIFAGTGPLSECLLSYW